MEVSVNLMVSGAVPIVGMAGSVYFSSDNGDPERPYIVFR
jgi:hypothetical protein